MFRRSSPDLFPRRRISLFRLRHMFPVAAAAILLSGSLVLWRYHRAAPSVVPLTAQPSPQLSAATADPLDYAAAVAREIRERGLITVTVQVALADRRSGGVPTRFGDGERPAQNLYWGARYGAESFLQNPGGWRLVHVDNGDGKAILQRIVLHKRIEPGSSWAMRGITKPFDMYVLANAWRASAARAAMRQPLTEALSDSVVTIPVNGVEVGFGSRSVMVGYVGPNALAEQYGDPFGKLPTVSARPAGVFYVSSMSAAALHRPVVDRGLYPVLFVRRAVVPEGYVLLGILEALAAGDLDEGFVFSAAEQYARYQKNYSAQAARFVFVR